MVLGVTFLTVCLLYTATLLIGWYLAKHGRLDVTRVVGSQRRFTDPITGRFQQWCHRGKMDALRRRQWSQLWALISANNLIAVALVGRTLYGITLVPAVYFTYRQGLGHGALWAQPSIRPQGAFLKVAGLEFGAYLLATALGVNLTIAPVFGGGYTDALRMLVLLYGVVAAGVLLGAWLEVRMIRSHMPAGLEFPADLSREEMRAKMLDMLKRQSGGAA